MKDKEKIISELKEEFEKTKKEIGFNSSFEDIDSVFFIQDGVMRDGFVSSKFSRQMCHYMSDLFMNWNNYLHSLIFPNPNYLINMAEVKAVNEEDKKEANKMISEAMGLVSLNTLAGIKKDKKMEAEFIDEAVKFWNERYRVSLEKVMKKINDKWRS